MKTGETSISDHIDCKTSKYSTTINICTPNNRHKIHQEKTNKQKQKKSNKTSLRVQGPTQSVKLDTGEKKPHKKLTDIQ